MVPKIFWTFGGLSILALGIRKFRQRQQACDLTPVPFDYDEIMDRLARTPKYQRMYYAVCRGIERIRPRRLYYDVTYLWARMRHGYSESDLWSMDYTYAKLTANMLRDLRKNLVGVPADYTVDSDGNDIDPDAAFDSWTNTLQQMEVGFRNYYMWQDHEWSTEEYPRHATSEEIRAYVERRNQRWEECYESLKISMQLMAEHFPSLWI